MRKFLSILIVLIEISAIITFAIFNINSKKDLKEQQKEFLKKGFAKPMMYFYPKKKTKIQATITYTGEFLSEETKKQGKKISATVLVEPDGKLYNIWEANSYSFNKWLQQPERKINWNISNLFVIKWEDTKKFFEKILPEIWLNNTETKDFIEFFEPLMKNNKYNLIHFAKKQYTDNALLEIKPKPDSILRVFMVYKPLKEKINIQKQKISPFVRTWFVVVEWGGARSE
jgi:uncharacterized protein YdhG (YjbR/CyaY superfamily)